jgi:hypothetical protein
MVRAFMNIFLNFQDGFFTVYGPFPLAFIVQNSIKIIHFDLAPARKVMRLLAESGSAKLSKNIRSVWVFLFRA